MGYGTADVNGTNINRLQYIDGDGTTRHDVATLDDGLKLAGDAGTGTVKLDSTLSVTGGEISSANLASGNNIGVTASDGALKLQLAKDLTGLNSVTAGTVVMGSPSLQTLMKTFLLLVPLTNMATKPTSATMVKR